MYSDPDIPSLARVHPGSVTAGELRRTSGMPQLPTARPGVLATPVHQLPAMRDLTSLVRALAVERTLPSAIARLQHETLALLRLTDALCAWLDWPHRIVWTLAGRASPQVQELVLDVAGSGRRTLLGTALLEPIGPPPARAVLAIRRASGSTFDPGELAMIATLTAGIAPTLDRLIAAAR